MMLCVMMPCVGIAAVFSKRDKYVEHKEDDVGYILLFGMSSVKIGYIFHKATN